MSAAIQRPNALPDLLAALDKQAELLELRCRQMQRLSAAIVQRDEESMTDLLEQIGQTLRLQAAADADLRSARNAVGVELGLDGESLRLDRLAEALSGEDRTTVADRRRRILGLADEYRRRHAATSLLLMECARINRMLLEAMLPRSRGVRTYGEDGAETWRPDLGVMNAER